MPNANSPLTSVNPGSFNQGPNTVQTAPQNNTDVSSGQFSVNSPQIGNTPLPQSNPIFQNANSVSTDILANATRQGDDKLAKATEASAKSGGSGIGGILGPIGSILGGLFADGGLVSNNYAQGGQVGSSQDALALGYLVGALHQRDFNGSPDSLQQAADMIKQRMAMNDHQMPASDVSAVQNEFQIANEPEQRMMSQSKLDSGIDASRGMRQELQQKIHPGFAAGGEVNADAQLAQQALAQALGLNTQTQSTATSPPNTQQQNIPVTQAAPQTIESMPQTTEQPQGYAQRFAMGGAAPSGDPNSAPLQPGQTFQGDGSVKGPGGPTEDQIPAKLSNGEYVMSFPAVQFWGVSKLEQMNQKGKEGYVQALQGVQDNQAKGPAAAMPQGQPQAPMQMPQPNSMPPQGQPAMKAGGFMQGKASASNTRQGYMGL